MILASKASAFNNTQALTVRPAFTYFLLQILGTKGGKVRQNVCIPCTCKKACREHLILKIPICCTNFRQQPWLKDPTLAELENTIHAEGSDVCINFKPKPPELHNLPKANGLVDFEWGNVESELSKKAPILTFILKPAVQLRKGKQGKFQHHGNIMAVALLKCHSKKCLDPRLSILLCCLLAMPTRRYVCRIGNSCISAL